MLSEKRQEDREHPVGYGDRAGDDVKRYPDPRQC